MCGALSLTAIEEGQVLPYLFSSEAFAPFIMSCLTMATWPFKQA